MNPKNPNATKPASRRRSLLLGALVIGLFSFAGCQHYNAQVAIHPDGSGRRTIEFTVDSNRDNTFPLTHEALGELFHIDSAHGWELTSPEKPAPEASAAGATFRRETTFDDFAAWSQADGDLRIQAARQGRPHAAVVFDNDLDVRFIESEEGRICQYREIFSWTGLRQEIAAFMADRFTEQMKASYPFLSSNELHELRGLIAGMIMLHLEAAGSPEGEEPDGDLIEAAITAHAEDILRRHVSDLSTAEISEIVRAAADDPMDLLDTYLAEELPGAYHAASTALNIAVTMPGPIIDTNADRIDGQQVTWELNVWDSSAHPVEIFVIAEVAE